MPIWDAKGFSESETGQELGNISISGLLGGLLGGPQGAITAIALQQAAKNKNVNDVIQGLDYVPQTAGLMMLAKPSKGRDKIVEKLKSVISFDPLNDTVGRYQQEFAAPFSRGGRGQVYYKYISPRQNEFAEYVGHNSSLSEGGKYLATKQPEFKGTTLTLHKSKMGKSAMHGTLERLLGYGPAKDIISKFENTKYSDLGVDGVKNLLMRLTGESKNKVNKLPIRGESWGTDEWLVKDFLMSAILKKQGIGNVIRNTLAPRNVDYTEVRPGDYSELPGAATKIKLKKKLEKQ